MQTAAKSLALAGSPLTKPTRKAAAPRSGIPAALDGQTKLYGSSAVT
jgi:hypothetical protein